ncbi:MAG TPA: DUF58 domain-containing protein, partial [Mycobacteriales bacterium]|nr:DUF58 domain-containing protein [Mycobacteriales bacterium]
MSVAPSTQLLRQRSDELFGTVPEAGALDRPITLRVPLGHGRVLSPVGFGFALAGVVLVSYAWAVGARPLALPGMLCLATTIIGIATARRVDGLGILVPTTRVRATLGQELCVDVDVIASRAQPTMRLQLDVPTLPAIVGTVPELRAGERTTVRLRGPAARRVVTDKVRITATDAGALGITSTSRAWTVDVDLAVVPAWHTVPAPPRIPVAADDNGDDGFTTIGRPRWSGVEPRGLRPLRRGDPWRAVHARASARRGRPIVR